jgi:molybdopterin synthase sulfur carrier subunit
MAVKVLIPTPLRKLTKDQAEVSIDGKTVGEMIEAMSRDFPGLKERLCDEQGKIRRFVNIYLNEEDIRFLQGEATALKDGDTVSIVPAIAGGHLNS